MGSGGMHPRWKFVFFCVPKIAIFSVAEGTILVFFGHGAASDVEIAWCSIVSDQYECCDIFDLRLR